MSTLLAPFFARAASWAPANYRELVQPGYFLIRLVRHGPMIAARIYWCDHEPGNPENKLDRWPIPFLAGEVAGEDVDPLGIWLARDRTPIDSAEYRFRDADRRWVEEFAPHEPLAKPLRKADLMQAPLPF